MCVKLLCTDHWAEFLNLQVRDSNFITYDMLENNFPFTILRNSFRAVYENKKKKQQKNENEI